MWDKSQYKIEWSEETSWRECNLSKDLKEVRGVSQVGN